MIRNFLTLGVAASMACFVPQLVDGKEIQSQPAGDELAEKPAALWPQDGSDIAVDANVKFGQLENGMRYAIMQNAEPPGRVSMRMHIAAGSLMERDDQRGVAHFLEHMVFNGSKHYPDPSELIPRMQRLGIAFGAHANAYTSFDETVYMLDLPNTDGDTLELGYNVMRDFCDGALLNDTEIDKERGVILAEKTSRDSVQMRLMEKQFEYLMPDSLIPVRFPIGTEQVIESAPRKAFTDFYSQFYKPENMTFVFVGDMDPAVAEAAIKANFETMTNPEEVQPAPDWGKVSQGGGFQAAIFTDEELSETDLSLIVTKPFVDKPDTVATRAERLPLFLANAILDRRFSLLAKEENAVITGGSAYRSNWFKFVEFGNISVVAADHNWEAALPVLEQETRRAIEYGFTEDELQLVVANLTSMYENSVKSADSRKSPALASSIVQNIHSKSVFSTPAEDLRVFKENIAQIDLAQVHQAFADFWKSPDVKLILTSKENADADKVGELSELYMQSKQVKVEAPAEREVKAFAYSDLGTAAPAPQLHEVKDLGFTQFEFANGVRVNFKKTDFEKNNISISAHVGCGKLCQHKEQVGIDQFANSTFIAGGLGEHSSDDLRQILAGKNVGVSFAVSEDSFIFSGATTPEDLKLQLELMCAYLLDPGYRAEAERQYKAQLPAIYSQMEHTQAGPLAKMRAYLRGDDGRFVFPTREQAEAFTGEDLKKWLQPQLEKGYMEVSVVGDFDPSQLVDALAATVGALPERDKAYPNLKSERKLEFPKPPVSKRWEFSSKVPTGIAVVTWKAIGLEPDTIGLNRRFGILSDILTNRLREKLREELGEAYSPGANFSGNDVFDDLGYVVAYSPGNPDQVDKVSKLMVEIAAELCEKGASQDELDRALQPRLSMLKKSLRNNGYWLGTVMGNSQRQPYRLDWARQRDADYAAITVDEINNLATRYLGRDNVFRFEIIPVDDNGE